MSNGVLPDYLSMAKPNPFTNRAPWYKNTAPTYAGIFLWFVFWSTMPSGGAGICRRSIITGNWSGASWIGYFCLDLPFSCFILQWAFWV